MSDGGLDGSAERRADEQAGSVRLGRLVMLVVGCVLFVGSVTVTTLLEGTPGEFGYIPFNPEPLPFAAMRGFTVEQLVAHAARLFLATPGLLLIWFSTREGTAVKPPDDVRLPRWAFRVSAGSIALCAILVLFVFRGRAIVDDELVYRMQAEYLSEGHLALRGLPYLREIFGVSTLVGFTGKYLFGEPLVQVPSVLLGNPALVHVPLAALTLWMLYRAVKIHAGAALASFATMLVACSPMFIFTTATAQSQATSLACVVAAGLGHALVTKDRPLTGALLVGLGIGFDMAVRIQVAVPAGAVFVSLTALALFRAKRYGGLALLAATLAFWAALIAGYDFLLSGHPFKLPWFLSLAPERYGFGQVWEFDTFRHTPWTALQNLAVTLIRFNAWWLGWPCSLLAVWAWLRLGRPTEGARPWLLLGLAVILFEIPYYSTGISDTGPIYHYELLLPGALLGANALRRGFAVNGTATRAFLVAQFGLGWTSFMWEQGSRIDRLLHFIHDDVAAAIAEVKPPALLFVETRCTEATGRAWVNAALPIRSHADHAPIVTFDRPPARYVIPYLNRYPDRSCWYFHVSPLTHKPAVMPCDAVADRFRQPLEHDGDACIWIPSTATRLGLYNPFKDIARRIIKKKKKGDAESPAVLR
ncbi:MAG TPA: hypothetical protein VHC69_22635 [Polyangiaceae bacterium]|nr:hypothetical protein [Polyangiaceae bacterium]